MKISYVIISVIFGISITFTIVGLVALDATVDEVKDVLGIRNQGFAVNMIQGLDKHIEERIVDFQDLTKLDPVQSVLIESNKNFEKIQDLQSYMNVKEEEIEYTSTSPLIGSEAEKLLSDDLIETIEFYRDEYNYDVVKELFVTNAYGANVALATGTSDYIQSDEDWWQTARDEGKHLGKIHFDENYDSYAIDFAFRVDDINNNFIGVFRVVITLDDLLGVFAQEAEIVTIQGRDVLLLDENGNTIFSNGKIQVSDTPTYYQKIKQQEDLGFLELEDRVDDFSLVSFAKSTGYETFAGFDWIAIVEQNSSSIVEEFNVLRNAILSASIAGMIASVIGGLLISSTISSPLQKLTKVANSISKGDFDVSVKPSKIDEIRTIGNAFEEMSQDLQKLIDTEKKLAEADIKIKKEKLVAIGELAASMAHDMKNPLSTIRTSAEILQKNAQLDDELKEIINRMNRAIDRITYQINDVLNYVRKTPLELKPIKVTELLQKAKESLKIPSNISCIIEESEIEINCDVRKLEIVFINLLVNSIQAIGKEKGTIECKIQKQESNVIIEIQDSGPGISKDIISRIFEPLVSSKQKGTGLGLSTCRNIIEQHKGIITAQNNPTRFTIQLPLDLG